MDDTGREMMSSQQWLSEQLDSVVDGTPGVLLLDCRAPNDYNASHVVGAIHVAIPPLLLRRLKKGNLAVSAVISGNEGRDQFARRCREETLIVYDDCSCDANINPTGIAWLLLKKLRGDGYRARMLNGKSPNCPLGPRQSQPAQQGPCCACWLCLELHPCQGWSSRQSNINSRVYTSDAISVRN